MTLNMELGEQSYDIIIKRGALDNAGKLLNLDRRVLVVTDSGVPDNYARRLAAQCAEPVSMQIEQGERSKCMEVFQSLLSTMLKASFTRGDCVAAVGGGVVGDLSAFAASCYMRGIDFYNIPTTLLSQVDSSIGGKTGIDFGGVKNAVGSFWQPKMVVIDPDTLKTLSARQLHAGLAEAIKMAATNDAELFQLIENSDNINDDIITIIGRSLLIKKTVVERDPKETGLRRVLNFGHTVGHAIESLHNGELLHGECVALGMLPMCSASVRERLKNVLRRYELPTEIRDDSALLLPLIAHDKKMQSGHVKAVYVDEIGSFEFRDIRPDEISAYLELKK